MTLTPLQATIMLLTLLVGFCGNAVNSGSFLGVATTPKAWIPWLTLVGGFLAGSVASLTQSGALNGSTVFTAVVAGASALIAGAGGAAAHAHTIMGKKSTKPDPVTAAAAKIAGSTLAVFLVCSCGLTAAQGVTDVGIGLNAAVCVLDTYSTDIQSGKTEADAVADAVLKCGVTAAQASGILSSHRKAETVEGYVLKPASK
jgi:hypothetical protein